MELYRRSGDGDLPAAAKPRAGLDIRYRCYRRCNQHRDSPFTKINGDVVLDPVSGAICNSVQINSTGGFGLCAGSPPIINGTVISPLFPADWGGHIGRIRMICVRRFSASLHWPGHQPPVPSVGPPAIPAGTTLGAPFGNALVQGDNYFTPGVYQAITSILITDDLTLDAQGNSDAVFVFQSSSTVGTADGAPAPGIHTRILLTGSARLPTSFGTPGLQRRLGLTATSRATYWPLKVSP